MSFFSILKYKNIVKNSNNPLKEVKYVQDNEGFLKDYFHAYVVLDYEKWPHLKKKKSDIYGEPDGSGTDKNKHVAIAKAVSEGLERWAFRETLITTPSSYGFDSDDSSSGMAAFPNFITNKSRATALLEAQERWLLQAFWLKMLEIREQGQDKKLTWFSFKTPFKGSHFVICYHPVKGKNNSTAYGFSSSTSLKKALDKSKVELDRNLNVISNYDRDGLSASTSLEKLFDRRLIYFSKAEGLRSFRDRIILKNKKIELPKLISDSEIKGPWSKHAVIWRALYEPLTDRWKNDEKFFFF